MEEKNRKLHKLSRSSEITLWGVFALCVLFSFSLLGGKDDSFALSLICFVPFGSLALSLIVLLPLHTSPAGIEFGSYLSRKTTVPWNALESIKTDHLGFVNLFYREQARIKQQIISVYVDDWQTNELVLAIRQFAPKLNFRPICSTAQRLSGFKLPT
jgi:hypothetical protein